MSDGMRADVRKSAASPRRINRRDRFASYALHHRQVARDSLRRLLRNPFGSLATWLVIGIALALPGALYVGLDTLAQLGGRWDAAPQISLFLHNSVDEAGGQALQQKLMQRGDVANAAYISREQALAEFRTQSGFGEVVEQLDSNPLPAVISVRPLMAQSGADAVRRLYDDVKAMPEVERAVLDMEWVQRLYALLEIGRRIAAVLAALLGLGVILVMGNTIRLAIESRRDEILVVKLVGATNAFVRRPFLYSGAWFGFGGGVVACLVLALCLHLLAAPVAQLASLYHSDFVIPGLGIVRATALLVAGTLLGWLGAWLAVGRHLSAIEPH